MKDNKELRYLSVNLETREEEEKMVVEGYAVMFESPATHGYTEVIDKNAFNGCNMKDVPLRYNHTDQYLILARTRNNSLKLIVDDVGLKIRAELIDTQANKDVYKSIKAGLLDKMSFAFTVSEESWDYESETRRILKIDRLFDVSVVDTPFYDTTSIYARALSTLENGKKELDNLRAKEDLEKRKSILLNKIKISRKEK